jgi:hypothetical protein
VVWVAHSRQGHFRSISSVFSNLTGYDVASLADEDFRNHVNILFANEPSQALVALACWRQIRQYTHEPEENREAPTRRRKRNPVNFGQMLTILEHWQGKIDAGFSESVAAHMAEGLPVSRTTLRSWRQIYKLALQNGIDLSSPRHAQKSISLSYVQRLVREQNEAIDANAPATVPNPTLPSVLPPNPVTNPIPHSHPSGVNSATAAAVSAAVSALAASSQIPGLTSSSTQIPGLTSVTGQIPGITVPKPLVPGVPSLQANALVASLPNVPTVSSISLPTLPTPSHLKSSN